MFFSCLLHFTYIKYHEVLWGEGELQNSSLFLLWCQTTQHQARPHASLDGFPALKELRGCTRLAKWLGQCTTLCLALLFIWAEELTMGKMDLGQHLASQTSPCRPLTPRTDSCQFPGQISILNLGATEGAFVIGKTKKGEWGSSGCLHCVTAFILSLRSLIHFTIIILLSVVLEFKWGLCAC
jgi:hypothetical protein